MAKKVIFRRIGGRVIPIRSGSVFTESLKKVRLNTPKNRSSLAGELIAKRRELREPSLPFRSKILAFGQKGKKVPAQFEMGRRGLPTAYAFTRTKTNKYVWWTPSGVRPVKQVDLMMIKKAFKKKR